MKARSMVLGFAASVALAGLAMAQDHAVPRGGGGGGSSTPSGGGQPAVHSSGDSGSGSSSSGSSGGYSSGTGSSAHTPSIAERRHPRAGTGSGSGGYGGGYGGYYPGYPYYPYYPGYGWGYPGFYGSYWWPYGSWGWYGGYWGNPWGWGGGPVYHYVQQESGAIRVLVNPSEARVYVDGYYAGTVDDFDGLFQRLNVSPGRHEITLKLEGYTTYRARVYVSPDSTLKLHYNMQKGTGETVADLAANVPESVLQRDRERGQRDQDQGFSPSGHRPDEDLATAGKLRLDVRPADASVYVDGAFRGTGREASSLQLPAGRHRLEIVRPGYRTVEREVEVTPGQTTDLSVDLEKGSI